MALTATVYQFDVDLADHDRGVYESLAIRAARHPSESEDYLWARVLAYALEYQKGIAFSGGGVSEPGEPPIAVRDLTGAFRSWVDIGTPDPERLHKAAKASPRVAVYVHKDPSQWLTRIRTAKIHRADALEIFLIDRGLIGALVARLDRRVSMSLAASGGELYISMGSESLNGTLKRVTL